MKENKIVSICGCGKPLYAVFNENGKRIGVTHQSEDEDYHFKYYSTSEIMKRINSN
ncbi:hypothetical protein [Empedobacter brevis]|uniref:hypothetical protein n=1 Tax=Empedobacter brevis TaxID=247 RepID=UPI003342AEC3